MRAVGKCNKVGCYLTDEIPSWRLKYFLAVLAISDAVNFRPDVSRCVGWYYCY